MTICPDHLERVLAQITDGRIPPDDIITIAQNTQYVEDEQGPDLRFNRTAMRLLTKYAPNPMASIEWARFEADHPEGDAK